MIGYLPGMTVEADLAKRDAAEQILTPVFMAGGLVLSQVSQLTGLEPHTIQNWVKRGFLPPPQNKKYNCSRFCRIAIINMLKDTLQLDMIVRLISSINGRLDDVRDDRIDDYTLYICFTRLLSSISEHGLPVADRLEPAVTDVASAFPDALRPRLISVLRVMAYAYISSRMRSEAVRSLENI